LGFALWLGWNDGDEIVQVAASGAFLYALSPATAVVSAERGRRALGWQLLPDPIAN
jgi:hypothetical protein